MRKRTWARFYNLFSLIELLIVIVIIFVLISILMPALRQTKSTARGIACINNLKQIGLFTEMYLSDYNRSFFPYYDGNVSWATYQKSPYNSFNDLYMNINPKKKGTLLDCPSGNAGWAVPDLFLDYGYNYALGMYRLRSGNPVVFCDAERYHLSDSGTGYRWDDPSPLIGVQWAHKDGANFLFYDGHALWKKHSSVSDSDFVFGH